MLLAALAACIGCREEKVGEPARTMLTVGVTESFPPMAFPGEDGAFTGYDIDLADEVWSTLLEMAADGTIRRISEKWFGSDLSLIPGFYAKATHGGGRGRRNK